MAHRFFTVIYFTYSDEIFKFPISTIFLYNLSSYRQLTIMWSYFYSITTLNKFQLLLFTRKYFRCVKECYLITNIEDVRKVCKCIIDKRLKLIKLSNFVGPPLEQ